jgi:hypothetical protein
MKKAKSNTRRDLHHELSVLIAPHLTGDKASDAGLFYGLACSLLHMATEKAVDAARDLTKKPVVTFRTMALVYTTDAYQRLIAGQRALAKKKKR